MRDKGLHRGSGPRANSAVNTPTGRSGVGLRPERGQLCWYHAASDANPRYNDVYSPAGGWFQPATPCAPSRIRLSPTPKPVAADPPVTRRSRQL